MGKNVGKIKTPDQRLRVFVSSTLRELAEERKAARSAIETIHLIPVMFELGARPHPPKDLYQAYLEQSHIFIGIYWQSYGWIAENEKISGLEDELLLSEKFPRLIYVKEPASGREKKLDVMLDFIRSHGNVSYKSFSSTEELSRLIVNDLAILISERFYSHSDLAEENKKAIYNNLPANLPHLVGREKEESEICDLILNKGLHLITITGPGGIGKTRLSLDIGKMLAGNFEDGIYFADFSGIFDHNMVSVEIAKLFGISISASQDVAKQITEFISEKKILLIIDNFEQLSAAGSQISALVTRCPNLTVIVTSRHRLELSIETEYSIDALTFPDSSYELSDIEMSPSVMLFCERARSAYKNFELTEDNIFIVADICRLLGGIPLAIELAAVKVRMFSLQTIKEKLTKKMDILSGGMKDAPARHRTMKAALEWSYDLLNDDEKRLFRRLSVFVNGFDYEAIENICCCDIEDTFGTIESLLTKNFFQKDIEIDGVSRYKMLELLHKYSAELFEQSGEADSIKTILADYYFKEIREDSSKLYGAIEAKITSRWKNDIQNVMNALDILFNQMRYNELIEMIYALWPVFWIFDNEKILEKRIDLQSVLQHDENLNDDLMGKLNWIAGSAAMECGKHDIAAMKFTTANQYFTLTNNVRGIAWTNLLINSLKNNPDKEESDDDILKAFNSSAELFKKCKDHWGESVAMQYIAAFEMTRGNFMMAIQAYDICRELILNLKGNESIEAYLLSMKALAFIEMDQFDKAKSLIRESTELGRTGNLDEGIAYNVLIITHYFFRINDIYNAMLFAGLCKNIFSKYNYAPWHMLSKLFSYIDDKVKTFNAEESSPAFQRGMNLNIYKAPEIAYKAFHTE